MQANVSHADNPMKRISKQLLVLGVSASAALLGFAHVSNNEGSVFCSCTQGMTYVNELPMSHPINRCATSQVAEVSWSSWFSAQSRSYQFHYLDLLELLSRYSDTAKDKPTA